MYRYAQVESALMQAHGIPETSRAATRARIKYLQRLGVAPASPGKGSRIVYTLSDACKWSLCLEFAQYAIDPARIASTVGFWWPFIESDVLKDHEEGDNYMIGVPTALSREAIEVAEGRQNLPFLFPLVPHLNTIIFRLEKIELDPLWRAMVINVSAMRRRVEAALAEAE